MVEPRELSDDLAGAEIEERVVDVGEHGAVCAEDVVVRGPAPRALLAQHQHAVERLGVERVAVGERGGHDGTAQTSLAIEDGLLPRVAVAVGVHAGGVVRARLRPRDGDVCRCALEDRRRGGGVDSARPHRAVGRRRHGERVAGRAEQ